MIRLGVLAGVLIYAATTFQWMSSGAAFVGCVTGVYALIRVTRLEDQEVERALLRNEKADGVLADASLLDDELRPPDG